MRPKPSRQRKYLIRIFAAILVVTILYFLSFSGRDRSPLHTKSAIASKDSRISSIGETNHVANHRELSIGANQSVSSSKTSDGQMLVTLEDVKTLLDRSMGQIAAVYATHQGILSADGSTQAVSFIYWTNTNSIPPSLEQMIKDATEATAKRQEADYAMRLARQEDDKEAILRAARLQVQANRNLAREKEVVTTDISLSTNNPPVLMFHKGVPEWIVFADSAGHIASKHFGGDVNMAGIMRAGVGLPPVFVFTDNTGKMAYVDMSSKRVFDKPPSVIKRAVKTRNNTSVDRQKRIAYQWDEFLHSGIDMNQFSLDGLTDLSKRTVDKGKHK